MTLLERYCAWSIEELNDETGLYTEEKLMVALDNIVTSKMGEKEIIKSFIQVSLELTSQVEPRWQEIAAKLYVKNLYEEVRVNRGLEEGANPYDNFYGFIKELRQIDFSSRKLELRNIGQPLLIWPAGTKIPGE